MELAKLLELSRHYGSDPEWVLAGGGNTSGKTEDTLYIKASGHPLASLSEEGLVRMDRAKLGAIWQKRYPEQVDKREVQALSDLMDSRYPEEREKRPSVETLMHELFPHDYVIHTHPALVNGLTCSREGKEAAYRLFPEDMLWIPLVNPGYVLAQTIRSAAEEYVRERGSWPRILLLQNHGLVIVENDPDEIYRLHREVAERVKGAVRRFPEGDATAYDEDRVDPLKADVAQAAAEVAGGEWAVGFTTNREIMRLVADEQSFAQVGGPFTPDHIVYAGHEYPFIPAGSKEQVQRRQIREAIERFHRQWGWVPKTLAVQGLGVFNLGSSREAVEKAAALFQDEVKIAVLSESFGGPRFMDPDQIDFILGWEVERHRQQVSTGE